MSRKLENNQFQYSLYFPVCSFLFIVFFLYPKHNDLGGGSICELRVFSAFYETL